MTLQKFSLADLDRVYYAEACEPIVAASKKGTIQIQALARDYYHGKSIVREVSEQIGFTTARYFATVFNEHYHCTPQQFREQAG
jgi:AraC-like DNA-binding protein